MIIPDGRPSCHPNRPHYALGMCRPCWATDRRRKNPAVQEEHRLESQRYRERNPEKRRAAWRKFLLKNAYDMTPEQFQKMGDEQDWKCAVCGQEKPLQVDHDHLSRKVRKLLCRECNLLVGWIEKHGQFVDRAIEYLKGFHQ
ncbi:MAG: endonuclease domain-containing protein [Mycobacteriales bacterium]